MTVSIRMFEFKDYQKLLEFYKSVDSDYFPRLSERNGGLEGHISTIFNNDGNFVLYEVNGNLEGVAGFFPINKKREVIQFTFFTFSKNFRGSLAPYRMVKYLVEKKDELGYSSTKKIIARTWYEESANRLERLGFDGVAVRQGDIIPNRTSFYFEGDLDFIIENILDKRVLPKKNNFYKDL